MSVLPQSYFHDGPWTVEDYFALPDDNARVELLDGALLVNPPPTSWHQRLCLGIAAELMRVLPPHMEVLLGVGVSVGPSRIFIPDLAVVTPRRLDVKAYEPESVLLAMEIVSPGSVTFDRSIKLPVYAEAGIPTYVRVEREGSTAHVMSLRSGRYELESSGTVLRLTEPVSFELDLAPLMSADDDGAQPRSL
jgi:Uma2 family endonuclease